MDASGYTYQPVAITGQNAELAIKSMQAKFIQRGNNLLGLVHQFATDYDRDAQEVCHSLDDSHNRAIEIGDTIEAVQKVDAIEHACNELRATVARGNQRLKRKVKDLEEAKLSARAMDATERGLHFDHNRDVAEEQKQKRARESSPNRGAGPNVILMADGRGAVAFDARAKVIEHVAPDPAIIEAAISDHRPAGVTRVTVDESSD